MLRRHGGAFAFSPKEIGCVDPTVVEPMVIFMVPHVLWSLKPIPVPRAHIPELMELLKQKMEMGILEPSSAPYSNRWFTVSKKNGTLRFIQDLCWPCSTKLRGNVKSYYTNNRVVVGKRVRYETM
jgi:hypothetical protein